jgi:hypothetical protein
MSSRRGRFWGGTARGQDRQVVDDHNPAGRGAIAQPGRDRREVPLELLEALVGRASLTERVGMRLDWRQHPQRPGQAGQREPGQETDVVAARGDCDQAGFWRYGVELRSLACRGRA